MTESDDESSVIWAIRLTGNAQANLEAGRKRFLEIAGEEVADAWQEGLEDEIATL